MSLLDRTQRRLYTGLKSLRFGRGGDAAIARVFGLDVHTMAKGRQQLLGFLQSAGGGQVSASIFGVIVVSAPPAEAEILDFLIIVKIAYF